MPSDRRPVNTEKVQLYGKLLAALPEIERKGDANHTAVSRNMFTLLHQSETLAIRLPKEEREKFLKKYKTTLLEAYGAVMKEYVRFPDKLLGRRPSCGNTWRSAMRMPRRSSRNQRCGRRGDGRLKGISERQALERLHMKLFEPGSNHPQ